MIRNDDDARKKYEMKVRSLWHRPWSNLVNRAVAAPRIGLGLSPRKRSCTLHHETDWFRNRVSVNPINYNYDPLCSQILSTMSANCSSFCPQISTEATSLDSTGKLIRSLNTLGYTAAKRKFLAQPRQDGVLRYCLRTLIFHVVDAHNYIDMTLKNRLRGNVDVADYVL